MARIRTVKPEFFRHEGLYEAEKSSGLPIRIAFEGLWTAADREGRFAWSPRTLKLDCLPYDDVDFEQVLSVLCAAGFIIKYEVAGKTYGHIPSWHEHQHINQREAQSKLPDPSSASTCTHVPARGEGKGREGVSAEPNGSHSDEADLYRRGKEICGPTSGGLIAKLLRFKKGSVPLARAAVEQAATKSDPREYLGRVLAGPPQTDFKLMSGIEGVL